MAEKLVHSRGVRLTESEWALAHKEGHGNESEGVRRLIEKSQSRKPFVCGFIACAVLYSAVLWVLNQIY